MTQMTITDWIEKTEINKPKNKKTDRQRDFAKGLEFMVNDDPICYSCQNALKRGRFRLCKSKGDGYTDTGEKLFYCHYYKGNEEE